MREGLDGIFHALSDPTRRAILARLTTGEHANGVLAGELPVSRPTVSKHLAVLRSAGLVSRRKEGRNWFYRLEPEPLAGAHRWLADYEHFWRASLESLKRHLEGTP